MSGFILRENLRGQIVYVQQMQLITFYRMSYRDGIKQDVCKILIYNQGLSSNFSKKSNLSQD